MKTYLYLDDFREPAQSANTESNHKTATLYRTMDWMIVRDFSEFVEYIRENGVPDVVSFDHDLGAEHYNHDIDPESYTEKTGLDCAKYLANYCMEHNVEFPEYYIHSMNPIGAHNIDMYIKSYLNEKAKKTENR